MTKATESATRSGSLEHLTTAVGVTVVVLAIILLVERELLRAHPGKRAQAQARAIRIASVPLVLAAIGIIGLRLAALG